MPGFVVHAATNARVCNGARGKLEFYLQFHTTITYDRLVQTTYKVSFIQICITTSSVQHFSSKYQSGKLIGSESRRSSSPGVNSRYHKRDCITTSVKPVKLEQAETVTPSTQLRLQLCSAFTSYSIPEIEVDKK